jgi:hypothetical protein
MTYLKTIITGAALMGAALLLPGCATLSESQCVAGNWGDRGYQDGENGAKRSRLADYADSCSEYGIDIDREAYLTSYETGLAQYCVPDNGFDIGRRGRSYKNVCGAPQYGAFRDAYAQGRVIYEIEQEHERLIEAVDDIEDEIEDVRRRLAEDELSDDERYRLRKKRDRLEDERQDLRYDLRRFEREHGL